MLVEGCNTMHHVRINNIVIDSATHNQHELQAQRLEWFAPNLPTTTSNAAFIKQLHPMVMMLFNVQQTRLQLYTYTYCDSGVTKWLLMAHYNLGMC